MVKAGMRMRIRVDEVPNLIGGVNSADSEDLGCHQAYADQASNVPKDDLGHKLEDMVIEVDDVLSHLMGNSRE